MDITEGLALFIFLTRPISPVTLVHPVSDSVIRSTIRYFLLDFGLIL